jgi:IS605 OrfB family transposase
METFNKACNVVSRTAWAEKTLTRNALHRLSYRRIREEYGLSSQLAVRAIGKVVESYKVEKKTLHVFRKHSAVIYDQRILCPKGGNRLSILTVDGRQEIAFAHRPDIRFDLGSLRGQADLLYTKGNFYLCFCIEVAHKAPLETEGIIGVDFGIVNLATTSEGGTFSGEAVDRMREKTMVLKRALQKRGTKSAKRHLKKLSGREARFKRITNHVISKEIVRAAEGTRRAIALEDLKGFHGRKTVNRAARERFGKWAFGQLRQFIQYKAALRGVAVIAVDPTNTSRTCSACGHVSKSNRKSQSLFSCQSCGTTMNADYNAALNIAARAAVNRPIAVHPHPLSTAPLGTASSVQPGFLTPCALGTG